MSSTPIVIETSGRHERVYDIYSRLLKDRIVFVHGAIQDKMADDIVAQLLFLETEDDSKPISLYINSPGGSVSAGLGIFDTMQHIKPAVKTVCMGMAASMGSILLIGGEPGERRIMPHGRVLIHQPLISGVMQGPSTDLSIEAEEIMRLRQTLYEILAEGSGKSCDDIARDCDRNTWLDASQALEYGIVDGIVAPKV